MASADFANEFQAATSIGQPAVQPIDSIAIEMAAGYNVLTPHAWQALPANERFELVKAQRAVFMSSGVSVPARNALEWLAANIGHGGDGQ